jgi:hypothetical protein
VPFRIGTEELLSVAEVLEKA